MGTTQSPELDDHSLRETNSPTETRNQGSDLPGLERHSRYSRKRKVGSFILGAIVILGGVEGYRVYEQQANKDRKLEQQVEKAEVTGVQRDLRRERFSPSIVKTVEIEDASGSTASSPQFIATIELGKCAVPVYVENVSSGSPYLLLVQEEEKTTDTTKYVNLLGKHIYSVTQKSTFSSEDIVMGSGVAYSQEYDQLQSMESSVCK